MAGTRLNQFWRENRGFIIFFSLMLVMRSSFADWYHVPTGSMQPNIVEGDRVFVDKMAYRLDVPFTNIEIAKTGDPKRGEVVVFESEAADERLIKRVIGIAGDKVAMVNNHLVINGEVADYEPLDQFQYQERVGTLDRVIQLTPASATRSSFDSVEVPEGHILVLGDNRNHSADSRYYGFVPIAELSGRATKVIVSLDPENYYLPRKERFLQDL